jgi:hypothetical protein
MRQRKGEKLRFAYLSTSKYWPTAAATFLRFRIRAATSPDGRSRLMRSTRRTGGIPDPELDMMNSLSTGTREAALEQRPGLGPVCLSV